MLDIYNHYVLESVITFEESPVSAEEMSLRIGKVTEQLPWLVYEQEGRILGFAYASKWKGRCAYRFSVESTIYLSPDAVGRGVGTSLYQSLIDRLAEMSYHIVIGGISLPNDASVGLHEKLGFEKVAHFREVGWKFNRWVDVGYWEKLLS